MNEILSKNVNKNYSSAEFIDTRIKQTGAINHAAIHFNKKIVIIQGKKNGEQIILDLCNNNNLTNKHNVNEPSNVLLIYFFYENGINFCVEKDNNIKMDIINKYDTFLNTKQNPTPTTKQNPTPTTKQNPIPNIVSPTTTKQNPTATIVPPNPTAKQNNDMCIVEIDSAKASKDIKELLYYNIVLSSYLLTLCDLFIFEF
jgi:hypothetical protein